MLQRQMVLRVKFIKRRARILLDGARVDRAYWPMAVSTAALEQRSAKLGTPPNLAAPVGAKCYVKTKKYKVMSVDDLKPKWTLGRYMGVSADVAGGHVILKGNRHFIQTLNVRKGEGPPRLDDVAPPYFVDKEGLPEPVKTVKGKTAPVVMGSCGVDLPSSSLPLLPPEGDSCGIDLPSSSRALLPPAVE